MASETTLFDPDDNPSFYRWATPILINLLSRGEVLPPPSNPTHRKVFRLTLQRMATISLQTLLANLDEKSYSTISNLAGKATNCLRMKEIGDVWPAIVTETLARKEWKAGEDEGVGGVGEGIDRRGFVGGQVWDRMDGDEDGDVEM